MKRKFSATFFLSYLLAFLLGAFLLSVLSVAQKDMLGMSFSLEPKAFVIPILFGGFSGCALSISYIHFPRSMS
jgi:hypothetical protein